MNRKGNESIAGPIAQLQRESEEHRCMRSRRARLRTRSGRLRGSWLASMGVNAVAQALWLD